MFVSVKFRDTDDRAFTYTSDLPLAVGDKVLVDARGVEKVVTVVGIDHPEPSFACKPIIGMAPTKEDTADE